MKTQPGLRASSAVWGWQESAACRGVDSAVFYSPEGERGDLKDARERRARQICAGCPVRIDCAGFALAIGERHGVWGGTTSRERTDLLRRPRRRP